MRTSSYPRIVRRRSTLHGWGVFALDPITKNTRIIHYAGEKISARESRAREAAHQARGHIWLFAINSRWVRDAEVGGNVARFINHDCQPNCYTRDRRRHHLDLRRAEHRGRGGALLPLLHGRHGRHRVPLPARLQEPAVGAGRGINGAPFLEDVHDFRDP